MIFFSIDVLYQEVIFWETVYTEIFWKRLSHPLILHVHLIVSVDDGFTISGFVRDSKKFTSKKILHEIDNSGIESRREWMLHQFKYYAPLHTRNDTYQLWEHDSHPIELSSPAFTQQKIDYIHDNPVNAGLVYRAEGYIYSSASNYAGIDQIIEVDCLFF